MIIYAIVGIPKSPMQSEPQILDCSRLRLSRLIYQHIRLLASKVHLSIVLIIIVTQIGKAFHTGILRRSRYKSGLYKAKTVRNEGAKKRAETEASLEERKKHGEIHHGPVEEDYHPATS